ncbi:hypothetical protein B0H10DRAFT_1644032, partial [Mycena sp. CBHHK59/15]
GLDSRRNCKYRLDSLQTNARASILAVLCAVMESPADKSLVIYTSSVYVICSFCFWAIDNATQGWTCTNGNEMRVTADWIRCQQAPTEFCWLLAKTDNL